MPRLPTTEEAVAQTAAHLDEVSAKLHSTARAEALFKDLENIIQASIGPWHRVRIVEALLTYRLRIEHTLDAKALIDAKRIVKRIRREIADLRDLRDQLERRLVSGKGRLIGVRRDCWFLYQSALQDVEDLRDLSGYDVSSPHERLAEVANAAGEACWMVRPPLYFADYEPALAILDGVLKRWAKATNSTRGQNWQSRSLNSLIAELAQPFEAVTGVRPDASAAFLAFANRTLSELLPEFRNHLARSNGTLLKRLRRSHRKVG
jgi:hypothetical protein